MSDVAHSPSPLHVLAGRQRVDEQAALYRFTERLYRAQSLNEVYDAALDTILRALRCSRASILLFDDHGVMRFVAWRGLSDSYRRAVEGHSPWTPDEKDPQPICVDDIDTANEPESLKAVVRGEGIRGLAFIPLVAEGKLVGKFMTYYEAPHAFAPGEMDLAVTIARQLGFTVERVRAEGARKRAEEQLRESESRFRMLADTAPALIWVNGLDGCEFVNRSYLEFLGVRSDDVRGYDWAQYTHPDDRERYLAEYRQAVSQKGTFEAEFRFRRRDGEYRWMRSIGRPRLGPGGDLLGYIGISTDITEHKQAEAALRAKTERYDALNRIARLLATDLDLERIVQTVTDSATELSGAQFGAFFYNVTGDQGESYMLYSLSGAPRSAFEKFGLPRNTAVFEPTFRGTGIVRSDDIRRDPRYGRNAPHRGMPEGHLPVVSYLAVPVISRSGEVHGGLFFGHERAGVFTPDSEEIVSAIAAHAALAIDNARLLQSAQREVEQRRRAEEELRQNEERERARAAELQAIMESVPAVIWIARDSECRVISGNRASFDLLRLPAEANPSLSAPEGERPTHFEVLVDGRVLPPDELPVQRAARGVEVRDFEEEVRFSDGTSRYLLGNATPLFDAEGNPAGAVAAFVDITERRRAEMALREGEQRLRLAMDAGRMGAWEWNIATGEVIWSTSLERIHGLEPGTFGRTFDDFKRDIHPDDLPSVLTKVREALDKLDDYHVIYRCLRPDGQVRWLEAHGQFVIGPNGRPLKLGGVCMDVTERRQAEERLRASEAELELVAKTTPLMLARCSRDLRFRFVNRAAASMYGLTPEQVIGRPIADVLGDEAFAVVKPYIDEVLRGQPVEYEAEIPYPSTGRRWMRINYIPDHDERGEVAGWIASIIDITDRKRSEEQKTLLIHELNHRVKNTLATVQSLAMQTLRNTERSADARDLFEARLVALSRAHDVLTNERWEGAGLREIALRALEPFQVAGGRMTVEGPEVRLSPKQALALSMAFHELATNAAKYGALSNDAGELHLAWSLTYENDSRDLHLSWTERGGPKVAPPKRKGFGSRMIERSLAGELGGEVQVDYRPEGLVCTIRSPLGWGSLASAPAD